MNARAFLLVSLIISATNSAYAGANRVCPAGPFPSADSHASCPTGCNRVRTGTTINENKPIYNCMAGSNSGE